MAFSPSYSPHEAYMKKYFQISKDEVFLDIGANIGLYTCFMAKRCKHVYAWEPSPQPFADLLTNVRRFQNVTVFDVALGENFAKLPFYIHSIAGHDSLVFQAGEFTGKSVNIKLVPLDSYESKDKVGLIKIDTEGYEVSVVKGALKTIKKHKPRLIIEIHGPSFREQVNAIKKMLPNYHWKRVYKEKATNIDSFHLVGQPFSGSS